MRKPKITWCKRNRNFQCKSVTHSPGEICFVSGEGDTPVDAFKQWAIVSVVHMLTAESRIKEAIGGESIWKQIRKSYDSLRHN